MTYQITQFLTTLNDFRDYFTHCNNQMRFFRTVVRQLTINAASGNDSFTDCRYDHTKSRFARVESRRRHHGGGAAGQSSDGSASPPVSRPAPRCPPYQWRRGGIYRAYAQTAADPPAGSFLERGQHQLACKQQSVQGHAVDRQTRT